MTDGELRDELVTLLLAGHETTATSVAWAIERLVRHPQKLGAPDRGDRRGRERGVHDGGGQRDAARAPGGAGVVRMLQEPTAAWAASSCPAGTRVVPSIYLTNRNPRVYEQPSEFRPERFLGSAPETFSWIPFGGGIRRCIGASFALLEMKLMLRTMLASWSLHAPAGCRRAGERSAGAAGQRLERAGRAMRGA